MLVDYLKEYCHELDREHLDTLCAIPQTRNPLYLLVMLNELRTLVGNDLNVIVPAHIASMSRDYPDTVALFRWVLQRLEVFGPEAVRWWCLYLAHGPVGMASSELADLLARKLGQNAAATALLIERGLRLSPASWWTNRFLPQPTPASGAHGHGSDRPGTAKDTTDSTAFQSVFVFEIGQSSQFSPGPDAPDSPETQLDQPCSLTESFASAIETNVNSLVAPASFCHSRRRSANR